MQKLILLLSLFLTTIAFGQDLTKKANKILAKGKTLYQLEQASWISTDHMLATIDVKAIKKPQGYITYAKDDKIVSTYWYKEKKMGVFYSATFDSDKVNIKDVQLQQPKEKPLNMNCTF